MRNSHAVEISIARGVVEMVREPNPALFFICFYFHSIFTFFIMCLLFLGTTSFVES